MFVLNIILFCTNSNDRNIIPKYNCFEKDNEIIDVIGVHF